MKRLSVAIAFSLLLLIAPSTVLAQEAGLRLTTSPLPITLTVDPGETVSTDLRIRNSGTKPETLKVGLLKFSADNQTGAAQLEERQSGDDYFDWVTFSEDQFTLNPNEWKTITMTIATPDDAAFGYYYAATFTRESTPETQDQQAIMVGSTATLVLLEVDAPDARRQIEVASFTTDHDWYEFLPATFQVQLKNTGNVHAMASGNIFIYRGQTLVDTIDINQLKGNILPQSVRSFSAPWSNGFPHYQPKLDSAGQPIYLNNQPRQELRWDFSQADHLRAGKYTAQLVMAYDNGSHDVPLEASQEFWIIPWRLILAAIAIPVIPAILVYLFMKWRMKKGSQNDF